jgi:chromate transporter
VAVTGTLIQLAALFSLLSVLAVGGGAGVIPDMQRAVVNVHHWMSGPEFLDMFAISRAAPGPGSLIVVLIGQKAAGLAGAAVAGLAMFLPSSVLAYLTARFWHQAGEAAWRQRVERALAPVAVGLTIASALALIRDTEHNMATYLVTGVATLMLAVTELNPLAMLAAGAAALLIFG